MYNKNVQEKVYLFLAETTRLFSFLDVKYKKKVTQQPVYVMIDFSNAYYSIQLIYDIKDEWCDCMVKELKTNDMNDYEHLAFYLKNKISDIRNVANLFDTDILGLLRKYEYLLKIMLTQKKFRLF